MADTMIDCCIIGAGPAGLTAAIYLARFHLSLRVIDSGDSRAALIPLSHNHAGYPGGISGIDLLARMRRQAEEFGAIVEAGTVDRLTQAGDGFAIRIGTRTLSARSVLLATGVVNHRPDMKETAHADALSRGLLRYCPICDAYEVTDRSIGVIGTGDRGCKEAIFLRGYSDRISLIAPAAHDLSDKARAELAEAGITLAERIVGPLEIEGDRIVAPIADRRLAFDTIYPALGSDIRSDLARSAGADASEDGCLTVDAHQRTSLPGLYAAGDVVLGLDQISNAMGQAGVAATTIRNDLAERRPLYR